MSGLLRWKRSSCFLLLVFLFVTSRRFTTEGAVTEKLDGSPSPPAVLKPDCVACCENPCGQVSPPPPAPPPPPPKKPTSYCPPPPPAVCCYQFGQPGSLYPYKPYDYMFGGSQRQVPGLPLAMV